MCGCSHCFCLFCSLNTSGAFCARWTWRWDGCTCGYVVCIRAPNSPCIVLWWFLLWLSPVPRSCGRGSRCLCLLFVITPFLWTFLYLRRFSPPCRICTSNLPVAVSATATATGRRRCRQRGTPFRSPKPRRSRRRPLYRGRRRPQLWPKRPPWWVYPPLRGRRRWRATLIEDPFEMLLAADFSSSTWATVAGGRRRRGCAPTAASPPRCGS